MSESKNGTAVIDPLDIVISDVTAHNEIEMNGVDGFRTASDVADSMASMMELPNSTPYSLRDEKNARMLEDDVPVGRQVEQGTRLVLFPKAHLA